MMLLLSLAVYFVPTMIVCANRHHKSITVMWINLLLGWTAIGWVIALIMALTPPKSA
jgi:ABC-type transport system involved in cytochrome c biogenesis permease component